MPAPNARRISCKRCQKRKIRCSRTHPCVNCSTSGEACEFRDGGAKRFPTSRDYVQSLETRIAGLEAFLAKLKASPTDQRNSLIEKITFLDHYEHVDEGPEVGSGRDGDPVARIDAATFLRERSEGNPAYHGPTSLYGGALAQLEGAKESVVPQSFPLAHSLDAGEGRMSECIALFFHWQYPQFMFVDREAFILDFQRRSFDGQFCSSALVNAVCSIGALMSTNPETRERAGAFAEIASALIMNHGLSAPHTTSVQALLCCAFYEVGLGNLSRGWLYAGMAFRMGQDLEFQRDPETWSGQTLAQSAVVAEFRRRIYWGCYVSDKVLSLMLGRPSMMHESDADVKPSQPLPQDAIFNRWAEERGLAHLKDDLPILPGLAPVFNKQVEIGRIIDKGISIVYSPAQAKPTEWTELALNEIDGKLTGFLEAVPAEMRLKEWSTLSESVRPHVAAMHVLYHSTRISLNRPFLIRFTTEGLSSDAKQSLLSLLPAKACSQSAERIVMILKRFKSQYGLRHAPLMFVHGAIAAVNGILSLARFVNDIAKFLNRSNLPDLEIALQDMTSTWAVAGDALGRLKKVMHQPQQTMSGTEHSIAEDSPAELDTAARDITAEDLAMQTVPEADPGAILGSTIDDFFWNPITFSDNEIMSWFPFQPDQ